MRDSEILEALSLGGSRDPTAPSPPPPRPKPKTLCGPLPKKESMGGVDRGAGLP